MEMNAALEMGRHAFWMTLTIAAPILVIGLAGRWLSGAAQGADHLNNN